MEKLFEIPEGSGFTSRVLDGEGNLVAIRVDTTEGSTFLNPVSWVEYSFEESPTMEELKAAFAAELPAPRIVRYETPLGYVAEQKMYTKAGAARFARRNNGTTLI